MRSAENCRVDLFGFRGDFLFADKVDEAQLMVVQNNGFMPTTDSSATVGNTTVKIPLYRSGRPVTQHYCAFRKTDNSGYYIEDFAEILKSVFSRQSGCEPQLTSHAAANMRIGNDKAAS